MGKKSGRKAKEPVRFVPGFRHYITGEWIEAAKYGHKAFPIPSRKRRPK